MTTYTCQQCNKPARVEGGAVVRSCTCTAPVIANLTATATGTGNMK
jgi:hypothetical protein